MQLLGTLAECGWPAALHWLAPPSQLLAEAENEVFSVPGLSFTVGWEQQGFIVRRRIRNSIIIES